MARTLILFLILTLLSGCSATPGDVAALTPGTPTQGIEVAPELPPSPAGQTIDVHEGDTSVNTAHGRFSLNMTFEAVRNVLDKAGAAVRIREINNGFYSSAIYLDEAVFLFNTNQQCSRIILTGNASTARGITKSSTFADMAAMYGAGYEKNIVNDHWVEYRYGNEDVMLLFRMLVETEYQSTPDVVDARTDDAQWMDKNLKGITAIEISSRVPPKAEIPSISQSDGTVLHTAAPLWLGMTKQELLDTAQAQQIETIVKQTDDPLYKAFVTFNNDSSLYFDADMICNRISLGSTSLTSRGITTLDTYSAMIEQYGTGYEWSVHAYGFATFIEYIYPGENYSVSILMAIDEYIDEDKLQVNNPQWLALNHAYIYKIDVYDANVAPLYDDGDEKLIYTVRSSD